MTPCKKVVFAVTLLACIGIIAAQGSWFFGRQNNRRNCRRFPGRADINDCLPCNLLSPKNVTLRLRNDLKAPLFRAEQNLNCTRFKTLFPMMQQAADLNSTFRFTAKYFGEPLGFFVEAFNDVFGNYTLDQSYWEVLGGDGQPTPVGVSTYEPQDDEVVTFNLTTSGHQ